MPYTNVLILWIVVESDVEYTGSYRRRQTRSVPEYYDLPARRSLSPTFYRRTLRERYGIAKVIFMNEVYFCHLHYAVWLHHQM